MSFLFAPAAGRGTLPPSADGESHAEVQRKTLRPLGANTLTQFEHPAQPVQEKEPPVRANPLTQFEHPAQPVQKRSRPERANPPAAVRVPRSAGAGKGAAPSWRTRLRQFECPAQPVQESAEFHRDKNFQENMRYPLAKYAKIGYYIQALFCMNSRMMLNDVKNTIIWRHSDYDRR